MFCYANTIIRIKHVKQNDQPEDSKYLRIWAIGTYPIGCETNQIEMILFVPVNPDDQDPASQAIFKRDEFYTVAGKIVPGSYDGNTRLRMHVSTSTHLRLIENINSNSNRCPLKISLIGVSQGLPVEIKSTENSIFEVSVTEYFLGQQYNFLVKVVFPHINSQFKHLKSIRPYESMISVIGQMEIIDNEHYIDAKDIHFIDYPTPAAQKKEEISTSFYTKNPTRSKLLYIHQNRPRNSDDNSALNTDNFENIEINGEDKLNKNFKIIPKFKKPRNRRRRKKHASRSTLNTEETHSLTEDVVDSNKE